MLQIRPKIISNQQIKDKYFRLDIEDGELIKYAQPGNFLAIRVSGGYEPLLRRPIGIHSIKENKLQMLYEVVGKGTQLLSEKKPGEYLDIIGPLGKGFDYRSTKQEAGSRILVAGGIGVAPLLFLAEKLVHKKIIVFLGAKTKNQILCEKEFRGLGCEVKIATDDGTKGFKGKVTDLLKNTLLTINGQGMPCPYSTFLYGCGPKPMLKEICRISQQYRIPSQVLLEAHMACGIGACLGCVVNTKHGFKRVCKDGPVFNADEIIWEE